MKKKEIEDFIKKLDVDTINFDVENCLWHYKNPTKSQIIRIFASEIDVKIKEYKKEIKIFEDKLDVLVNLLESYKKIEAFEKGSKKVK